MKLFIDFAHFGPGRGKVRVLCVQCRSSREARRTGLARRSRPGPASTHRVTGAILGPAIPAPSPASSTSRNSGKNHMNPVLVPLNDVKGHRGPQPRGAGEAGRETSVPRPAERPFAETRVSARARGAHTGPLPCRLSLERPVGLSLISLFDSRIPSSECGPLLGGVRFLLDLLPHFFTPHSLGFPCSP